MHKNIRLTASVIITSLLIIILLTLIFTIAYQRLFGSVQHMRYALYHAEVTSILETFFSIQDKKKPEMNETSVNGTTPGHFGENEIQRAWMEFGKIFPDISGKVKIIRIEQLPYGTCIAAEYKKTYHRVFIFNP